VTPSPRGGNGERFGALFSVEARLIAQSGGGVEPQRARRFLLLQQLMRARCRGNDDPVKIELDDGERDQTLHERGLDMARASEIFSGATLTVADDRRDYGEDRFITIGFLDARMVVGVWTRRRSARRIISLRKANDREKAIYARRF
jgi:uncharacterized DUF497 family protein